MSYSIDSIDIAKLPLEIKAKLAELDIEISEGIFFVFTRIKISYK